MLQITSQSAHAFQLSEFRDHVGIGYTDDDPALQRSLDAAITYWEHATGNYTRDTTFTLDWYTASSVVAVSGGTLVMSAVSRLAPDGATSATVTSDWFLTRDLGQYVVRLTDAGDYRNGYRYTGTFTVTAAAIEPTAKAAIYGLGNHLFTYRSVGEEVMVHQVPFTVRAIIQMYSRGIM
jgi:uncharacterized phiE125 gp8 family phage protein